MVADNQQVTVQKDGVPVVTFLKKRHELAKLLRSLDEASKDAVKFLVDTLADKNQDTKLRAQCAERLLSFNVSVAAQISADEMARLIAEVKLSGKQGITLTPGEPKPATPRLNFSEIREV